MTRRWAIGVVMAATLPVLCGCQKVTRAVSSSVSPCFRVLPQAHQAVGGQGAFVDVVRIRGPRGAAFPARVPPRGATTTSTTVGANPRDVCVVAYAGTFDTSRVQHLIGANRTGRYALVIVSVRTQRVRAVALSDRLPPPLHKH